MTRENHILGIGNNVRHILYYIAYILRIPKIYALDTAKIPKCNMLLSIIKMFNSQPPDLWKEYKIYPSSMRLYNSVTTQINDITNKHPELKILAKNYLRDKPINCDEIERYVQNHNIDISDIIESFTKIIWIKDIGTDVRYNYNALCQN